LPAQRPERYADHNTNYTTKDTAEHCSLLAIHPRLAYAGYRGNHNRTLHQGIEHRGLAAGEFAGHIAHIPNPADDGQALVSVKEHQTPAQKPLWRF